MQMVLERREAEMVGHESQNGFYIEMGAHIMSVLSNLYSDVVWAIVREYGTNMLDGYVAKLRELGLLSDGLVGLPDNLGELVAAAGLRIPRIKLPNGLDPHIEFTDFGIGMSHETVLGTFRGYGASSKRGNNNEVGGLGLGAKVAFAYEGADNWIIESRWHGQRMLYNALKDGEGMPTLLHVDTVPTDEPNGVTVKVPILAAHFGQIRDGVDRLLLHYPMDVEVAGVVGYKRPTLAYHYAGTNWGATKRSQAETQVLMGNIGYPVDYHQIQGRQPGHYYGSSPMTPEKFVLDNDVLAFDLRFPVGALSFTPSREALKYDDANGRTRTKVKIAAERAFAEFKAQAEADLAGQPTLFAALKALFARWNVGGFLGIVGDMQWRGERLATEGYAVSREEIEAAFPTAAAELHSNWGKVRVRAERFLPGQRIEIKHNSDAVMTVLVDDLSVPSEKDPTTLDTKDLAGRVQYLIDGEVIEENYRTGKRKADGTYKVVVLRHPDLTTEAASALFKGFPVRLASSLPKKPRAERTATGPRTKASVKSFDTRANIFNTEVDPEEGGIYVRMEGGMLPDHGTPYAAVGLFSLGKEAGIIPADATLYALPRTFRGLEKKSGWVELNDAIRPHAAAFVKTHAQDVANHAAYHKTRVSFREVLETLRRAKILPEGSLPLKYLAQCDALAAAMKHAPLATRMADRFELTVPKRAPLHRPKPLEQKISDRYPMFTALYEASGSSRFVEQHRQLLTDYFAGKRV